MGVAPTEHHVLRGVRAPVNRTLHSVVYILVCAGPLLRVPLLICQMYQ